MTLDEENIFIEDDECDIDEMNDTTFEDNCIRLTSGNE
jgi:hypothetical protein